MSPGPHQSLLPCLLAVLLTLGRGEVAQQSLYDAKSTLRSEQLIRLIVQDVVDQLQPAISELTARVESLDSRLTSFGSRLDDLAACTPTCSCPAGFSLCGGRCLVRVNESVTYPQAQSLCAELGAHLAVPRTETEHKCLDLFAGDQILWLGISDEDVKGHFVGADGCGDVPSDGRWALRRDGVQEPDGGVGESYVVYVPPNHSHGQGWHDNVASSYRYPLCQLPKTGGHC